MKTMIKWLRIRKFGVSAWNTLVITGFAPLSVVTELGTFCFAQKKTSIFTNYINMYRNDCTTIAIFFFKEILRWKPLPLIINNEVMSIPPKYNMTEKGFTISYGALSAFIYYGTKTIYTFFWLLVWDWRFSLNFVKCSHGVGIRE